jgi:hypothetical protein
MKRECAKLYNDGWPRTLEIKGTTLWGADRLPGIPDAIKRDRIGILNRMLGRIAGGANKAHYLIAHKPKIPPNLLQAEYGIAYNYLCGSLVCGAYSTHYCGPLNIVVDQRSKETHTKMKFDGYLQTKLVTECKHGEHLSIRHDDSAKIAGLQAVDLISWALFRNFEHGDPQFMPLITPIVGHCDTML